MPDRTREEGSTSTPGVTRRQAIKLGAGGVGFAALARVAYEYTGFGTVGGTNVTEQSLAPLARDRLAASPFTLETPNGSVVFDGETAGLRRGDGEWVAVAQVGDEGAESPDVNATDRLPEPISDVVADVRAIARDAVEFEFAGVEAFFQRLRAAELRPFAVAALRGTGFDRPDREAIREFTGADLDDPAGLVAGLAEGFAARTHFDVARYVAGSIEDHLLLGTVPVGEPFREPTDFQAILAGVSGLYCYQYALRSIEAFHAVAPPRQSPPVFGALVLDDRHNHAYTALASVVREAGRLRIPMTFLDYYYATLFSNLGLEWALGEGIDAYDGHHRATDVRYGNVYGT